MHALHRVGGPSKALLAITVASLLLLYSQSSLFSFVSPTRYADLVSQKVDDASVWREERIDELERNSRPTTAKVAGGQATQPAPLPPKRPPPVERPKADAPAVKEDEEEEKEEEEARPKPDDEGGTSVPTRAELVDRFEPYLLSWLSFAVHDQAVAFKSDSKHCPASMEEQSNPDQLADNARWWEDLSNADIQEAKKRVIDGVRAKLARGYDHEHEGAKEAPGPEEIVGDGTRGIVVTGGNADTMKRLLVMLRILRKRYKSKLPVEVWAFEEELRAGKGMITPKEGEVREELVDVEFKQLPSSKIKGIWKNFQIKGEAINRSRFTQILYLDSDNIPLVDPDFLFDSPTFAQYGAVLWPDITKDGPRNPIWRMTPQTCIPQDWQVDSGQILVDRKAQRGLVAAALLVAEEMQRDHEFWFRISGGDKDTFRYAFYALQLPWTRAPHWLSSGGGLMNNAFCGHTMFQYALSPDDWTHYSPHSPLPSEARLHAPPLFMHANLLKHSRQLFAPGTTFTHLNRVVGGTSKVPDSVARGNLEAMDRVRGSVRKGDIMCVVLSVAEKPEDAGKAEDEDRLRVVDEAWGDAWGGVLRDFPSIFWEEGGVAGGF